MGKQQLVECHRDASLKETEELRSAHERFVTYVQTNLKVNDALPLCAADSEL